jgi:hypothetical protein
LFRIHRYAFIALRAVIIDAKASRLALGIVLAGSGSAAAAINRTSGVTGVNRIHTVIKTSVRIAAAAGCATRFGGKRVAAARAVQTALGRVYALHVIAGDGKYKPDNENGKYQHFPQNWRSKDLFHCFFLYLESS